MYKRLKKFSALILLLLLNAELRALDVGDLSPVVSLSDSSGRLVTLNNGQSAIVLLDFWASWCGPCKKSLAWFKDLQLKYGKLGFKIVAINLDQDPSDARKLLNEISPNYQVLFDPQGRSAQNFKVNAMPSSVLLDRHGKVLSVFQGFSPYERARIEDDLKRALELDRRSPH